MKRSTHITCDLWCSNGGPAPIQRTAEIIRPVHDAAVSFPARVVRLVSRVVRLPWFTAGAILTALVSIVVFVKGGV